MDEPKKHNSMKRINFLSMMNASRNKLEMLQKNSRMQQETLGGEEGNEERYKRLIDDL
jgi:hypothetical protein